MKKPKQLDSSELADLLRGRGIRPTRQRVRIGQELFRQTRHLSAEQVMEQLQSGEETVAKATVYNTLGLFARKGLVREVIVDPSRVFYDPNTKPHHHFYDIDKGTLADIDEDDIALSKLPKLPKGTVADGVDVVIRVRSRR